MSVSKLVLNNLPPTFSEVIVKDFVEGTLDVGVRNVDIKQALPGRALVTFEYEIDFLEASKNLKDERNVGVQRPEVKPDLVIVSDVDAQYLSGEFLEAYFCSQFGDGEDIVSSCCMLEKFNMAIVGFREKNMVMDSILAKRDHVPLPSENYHILVEPFYRHFYGCLEKYLLTGGDDSEMLSSIDNEMKTQKGMDSNVESPHKVKGAWSEGKETNKKLTEEGEESHCADNKDLKVKEQGKESMRYGSDSHEEEEEEEEEEKKNMIDNDDIENVGIKIGSFVLTNVIPSRGALRGRGRPNIRGRQSHYTGNSERSVTDIHKQDFKRGTQHNRMSNILDCNQVNQLSHNPIGRGSGNARARGRAKLGNNILGHDRPQQHLPGKIAPREARVNFSESSGYNISIGILGQSYDTRLDDLAINSQEGISESARRVALEKEKEIEEMKKKMKSLESDKQMRDNQVEVKERVTNIEAALLTDCFGTFENCKVTYAPIQERAVLEGLKENVSEKHLYLLNELTKLKEDSIELDNAMSAILSTSWQQPCLDKLNKLVSTKKGKVIFENSSLNILAHGEDNLESAMELIKDEINGCKNIPIQGDISKKEFQHLKAHTESKFAVIISLNKGIELQGMKEDVKNAASVIEAMLGDFQTIIEPIEINTAYAGYVNQILMRKISTMPHEVKVVEHQRSDSKVSFTFYGTESQVKEAKKMLDMLISQIRSKSWDLATQLSKKEDLMLVANSVTLLKPHISDFQSKRQCYVSLKLPKVILPQAHACHAMSAGKKQLPKSRSTTAAFEGENSLVYNMTNNCQLDIQPYGNITQEDSDILVCILDDKVNLKRTRVGSDFAKTCPTMCETLKEARAEQQNSSVVVTQGPFKELPSSCKAVYHVILSKWSQDSSKANLTEAVKSLVKCATKAGLTSISIPPLGCGRVHGYPRSAVAQMVMQTLQSRVPQSSLKKVVLLALDSKLMEDYKSEAEKRFSLSSPSESIPAKQSGAGDEKSSLGTVGSAKYFSEALFDSSYASDDDFEIIGPPESDAPGTVTIWADKEQKLDSLWSELKEIIMRYCLHEATFEQREFENWPKALHRQIIEEAKQKSAWAESFQNSKTKRAGFYVKGEKGAVEQIMDIIKNAHKTWVDKMPKRICSETAPKRGGVDFIKHAASCDEFFPSYWELYKKETDSSGFLKNDWNKLKQRFSDRPSKEYLVDVDSKTHDAIDKLVTGLFDSSLVGAGADAPNLTHNNIKVLSIKRVENPVQFDLYNANRKRLFEKCLIRNMLCTDIAKVTGSKGGVATTAILPSFMKQELYWEVNEHYFFHGTKSVVVDTLVTSGPDPRVGNGMLGKGIYMAERTTKSDQYTDPKYNRTALGETLTLVMFRACLGEVFLCDENHESFQSRGAPRLTRPPCINCKKDMCSCAPQNLYDSVMGDGKWIFREFVVYERNKCYPEYIISYKRV